MPKTVAAVAAVALLLTPIWAGQKPKKGPSSATIERGKYLVEQVGMCGDCHSPRNEKGDFVKEKWLGGAPLSFKPAVPMLVWADKAPNIAGLPGWDNVAAIKFMMTGIAYNDLPARPPMPQYRFNQQDATTVVAYLKSLGPQKSASGEQR